MTAPNSSQLAGRTIVVTSDRRSAELIGSLERRGAQVLHAPTLRIVPLEKDELLHEATEQVLRHPPDDVVVTTAVGLRGWLGAVDAAGSGPELRTALGNARVFARGPKACGAIRAAGFREHWSAERETTAEIVDKLLAERVRGRHIAFQLHGVVDDAEVERLRTGGASVQPVPVYRWGPSPDPAAVARGIDAICRCAVDAVVFTSAPGAAALLDAARESDRSAGMLEALRDRVISAAVGDVTAGPLRAAGLDPLVPDRPRLGALVRCLPDHVADHLAPHTDRSG